ncbi:MAG: hypothetical protein M1839_003586 [Geoglossum umbratile]|nr:MAG: hypothetical protein M1839_003586 [Geoglossum umbratile]
MRTGKPDNLRKHQRNLVRTCKTQQIPVITPEEGQRFAAIGAAEEGKQLEDAVYFPVALFEKDKAMGVRGSQKTLMPLTCDESLGGGETASRDRGQPESSRASLRVLPAAPQPLSQAEASMDMASQVKQMKGQLAELSAAFLKQNAVLLKQNHKLNYLMAQVGSQEKPAPNTLQGAQNMLAASGPSSPGGLSERLRKENQDYEARIRQLEEQNQMLIHQLRRRDLSEEPRLPGDKEDAGPLSGNDPMGFSLNSERDAECPEGVDFEDFIHSIPSDASEADR